jgi:hypothetical protein
MLAAESAALPVASMRKGPISQSAGMARTRKKTRTSAPKNRRKPKRRRRRRAGSPSGRSALLTGVETTTGFVIAVAGTGAAA